MHRTSFDDDTTAIAVRWPREDFTLDRPLTIASDIPNRSDLGNPSRPH
jgi:hypothetical protein